MSNYNRSHSARFIAAVGIEIWLQHGRDRQCPGGEQGHPRTGSLGAKERRADDCSGP